MKYSRLCLNKVNQRIVALPLCEIDLIFLNMAYTFECLKVPHQDHINSDKLFPANISSYEMNSFNVASR